MRRKKLRTYITVSVLAAAMSLGTAFASPGQFPCAEFDGAKAQQLLEYLQRDRSALRPECAVLALQGLNHYVPAVKTLIKYLDYAIPGDAMKAPVGVIMRLPWLGEKFPAFASLYEIGRPASNDLVAAIAQDRTSGIARANAIQLLFEIYRDGPSEAVALLRRSGERATDRRSEYLLIDAARKTADMCRGDEMNRCLNALRP